MKFTTTSLLKKKRAGLLFQANIDTKNQFGDSWWNRYFFEEAFGFITTWDGESKFIRQFATNLEERKAYLKENVLNGKPIAYCYDTVFEVHLGKGKSAYNKGKWTFKGSLAQAVHYYNSLNIGNGYKKRLVAYSLNKPILARHFS